MQFDAHQFVWFFWLIPALVVAFLFFERRRLRLLYSFFPKSLLPRRLPDYASASPVLRFVLFVIALGFLGFALLMPYSDYEVREVKRKGVDLYFLVDLSQSMLAQDIKPSRIGRAQREIVDFIKILKGDRVGLIGFAGTSFVFVPLTVDYSTFDLFVNELTPDVVPIPGTDIKGSLEKAVASFKTQSASASKGVILITDGEDSIGLDQSVLDEIKSMNIKVFVIGIGTADGAPIPLPTGGYKNDASGKVVITKLEESALQNLAVATGGGYVRSVTGDMDLEQIYFQGIKKAFADADLAIKEKKLPVYDFQIFILIGFLLLVLEILITNKRWFWLRLFWRRTGRVKKNAGHVVSRISMILLIVGFVFPSVSFATNPFQLETANKNFQHQEYEQALQGYLDILKNNPSDSETQYNLGETYYRLERYDEAEKAYKKALNASDMQIRKQTLYNLGNTVFRKKDLKAALDYYAKALQMDGEYTNARLNHDYVKKLLEEQEKQKDKQEQNKEEQEQQEQQQKEEKQEQQDEQDQGGEGQQSQGEQDQEQQQGQDEQQDQQDKSEEQGQDEKKEKADSREEQPEEQGGEEQQGQGLKAGKPEEGPEAQKGQQQVFEQDKNANAWLESLSDEPGKVMRQMMLQQAQQRPRKKIEKDW